MSNYPFAYKITDDVNDISDSKYRVMLKSFMKTYKITTMEGGNNLEKLNNIDYVSREWFLLYLKDIKTGECYKFQDEPENYRNTFSSFLNSVQQDYN